MASKLIFDEGLMDEITAKYTEATGKIDEIIKKTSEVKNCVTTNYKGQATDIMPELLDKLNQHLSLLRDCCENNSSFVTHTKDEMVKQDKSMGEAIRIIVDSAGTGGTP